MQELTDDLELFQWHCSLETLERSFVAPSGLSQRSRLLYGERMAFHRLMRRMPVWLDVARRPWDSLISACSCARSLWSPRLTRYSWSCTRTPTIRARRPS